MPKASGSKKSRLSTIGTLEADAQPGARAAWWSSRCRAEAQERVRVAFASFTPRTVAAVLPHSMGRATAARDADQPERYASLRRRRR